jgi:hypothetical protein
MPIKELVELEELGLEFAIDYIQILYLDLRCLKTIFQKSKEPIFQM